MGGPKKDLCRTIIEIPDENAKEKNNDGFKGNTI